MNIKSIGKSSTVRAALVHGFGGLGFALGNLLLAREMSPADFAWVALVIALSQLAYGIGPMGLDTILSRYPVDAGRKLLLRTTLTSAVAGLGLTLFASGFYQIPQPLVPVTLVFCIAISLNRVAASIFRGHKQFGPALFLVQAHNIAVAVVAAAALALDVGSPVLITATLALLYVVSAAVGWRYLLRRARIAESTPYEKIPWSECIPVVASGVAVVVFVQLERLVIPPLLGTEALATFAVLAAVVGSPYRVLQMGVGFTLLPMLRHASTTPEKRRILAHEGKVIGSITAAGSILVWVLAPFVIDIVVGAKYEIGASLIAAGIVAGIAKILAAFGQAAVTSVATSSELRLLGLGAWLALAFGLFGAISGAEWGFNGIIYGVSAGWLAYALWAAVMASRHFFASGE